MRIHTLYWGYHLKQKLISAEKTHENHEKDTPGGVCVTTTAGGEIHLSKL